MPENCKKTLSANDMYVYEGKQLCELIFQEFFSLVIGYRSVSFFHLLSTNKNFLLQS